MGDGSTMPNSSKRESLVLKSFEKLEEYYRIALLIAVLAVCTIISAENMMSQYLIVTISSTIILMTIPLFSYIIKWFSSTKVDQYQEYFYIQRGYEVLTITLIGSLLSNGTLIHFVLILPIIITFYYRGTKHGLIMFGYATLLQVIITYMANDMIGKEFILMNVIKEERALILGYLLMLIVGLLVAKIHERFIEIEGYSRNYERQLNEGFDQLVAAKAETRQNREKMQELSVMMEDMHIKLRISRAEMFTVQQVVDVIGVVFDIKELLRQVNDVVIGVMGVTNSIICFYDSKRGRLNLHTTNIINKDELQLLNDKINCPALLDVLNSNKGMLDNNVDVERYPFTEGRGIKSMICVPLGRKDKKIGIILIEHIMNDLFNDENRKFMEVIGQQVSIGIENSELYNKMQEIATTDGLTGIYNRLYFQQRIAEEIRLAKENKCELSVAIFDIDHFKKFNDTYGHLFGDRVLKQIADIVKSSIRSVDVVARFGGEEFIILFPNMFVNEAYIKTEQIRQKIARKTVVDGDHEVSVTVSFGLASYPTHGENDMDIIRAADDALYIAKASGRNCVKIAGKDTNNERNL